MQTYDRDIVFNKIMRVLNALLKAIGVCESFSVNSY